MAAADGGDGGHDDIREALPKSQKRAKVELGEVAHWRPPKRE
jgi:hypothetical protein